MSVLVALGMSLACSQRVGSAWDTGKGSLVWILLGSGPRGPGKELDPMRDKQKHLQSISVSSVAAKKKFEPQRK